MARKTIAVLGGGGGVATAANLGYAVGREHDVVLIDRNPFHVYMPSLLMAMTEERRGDQLVRDLSRLERQHVRVLRDTIRAIDPERRRVELENGSLGYDYLVISLGLATHPEAIPGFVEAGGHHAWELDAALRCRDALQTFTGGRLVVALSPGLYRCPPAPYETLFSLDTLLTRRRVRANTELIYLAPGPGRPASRTTRSSGLTSTRPSAA